MTNLIAMPLDEPAVEWIDITKQMPNTEVLAIGNQSEMLIGYCFQDADDYGCEGDGNVLLYGITHWMNLDDLRRLKR